MTGVDAHNPRDAANPAKKVGLCPNYNDVIRSHQVGNAARHADLASGAPFDPSMPLAEVQAADAPRLPSAGTWEFVIVAFSLEHSPKESFWP